MYLDDFYKEADMWARMLPLTRDVSVVSGVEITLLNGRPYGTLYGDPKRSLIQLKVGDHIIEIKERTEIDKFILKLLQVFPFPVRDADFR